MSEKEDRLLDILIRHSEKKANDNFKRPDENTITAYLQGYADQIQRDEIHQAMNESPQFRREILDLASLLDEIDTNEIIKEAREIDAAQIPKRKVFLKNGGHDIFGKSFWEKIKILISWKVYVPVAATVLILFLFYMFYQQTPHIKLVSESVEKERLISLNLRQTERAILSEAYSHDQDAALAGFSEILTLENIDFEINPDYHNPPSPDSGYKVHLRFMGEGDIIFEEIQTTIKYIDGNAPEKIKAWILTLPSLQLWNVEINKPKMTIPWNEEYGKEACVTFTYEVDSQFRHGEVFSLKIE